MNETIQFLASLVTQLILIRAYCKLLDMRSNVVFGVLSVAGMIVALVVDALFAVPLFRTAVMGPVVFLVLPIACSRGPLRQRVLRCALIVTAMMLSLLPLTLMLLAIYGASVTENMGYTNATSALINLFISVASTAFFMEVLLALVARWEKRKDITLVPPFVLLLLWSYLITVFCFTLAGNRAYGGDLRLGIVACAYYVLVLALCAASVALFRGDVQTARHESQRALTDEQSKLVRAEIDAATKRAATTRRLHHVLANKAETICELVERGDTQGAKTYLCALRDQAGQATNTSSDGPDTGDEA